MIGSQFVNLMLTPYLNNPKNWTMFDGIVSLIILVFLYRELSKRKQIS